MARVGISAMETDVNRERSKQESEGQKCRIRVDLEAVVINNWVSLFETETLGKEQFKKKSRILLWSL